jgi:arsenate reductase
MNTIYYLENCSTCKRIIHELNIGDDFIKRDIKLTPITESELDELKNLAGSYEKLFSRIAMKYKILGLNKITLSEVDYKKYILEEYTFIKRPILVIDNNIYIGSSRPIIAAAKVALNINT